MSELATQQPYALDFFKAAGLAASAHSDAEFDKMAAATGYLPYLTHYTSASKAVKKGEVEIGFYLVTGKDDRVELGKDIDVVPLAWRFKAIDHSAGRPISSTDPKSDLFLSIADRAKGTNSHCQAGIEYLVWIPALAKFGTYLMGSKTAVKEAAKVKPFIGCAVTIKTHKYENDEFVWEGPKVYESSVPPSSLPDMQTLKDTVERFNNPPAPAASEAIEEVKPASGKGRAR